jgi:hypothetical protein
MIFMVINCMVLGILGIQSASEEVMKGRCDPDFE